MGFEGDDMACLTHLNPYTLCLRGKAIDMSYIVGLATHPAARRKAGFYQPYGYELYCHQWKETMPLEALRPLTDRTVRYAFVNSPDQWPYLAAVYEGYTKGLSGYALRDEQSWRSHIEAQLAEGNIAVCFDGDEPIGYAFYQLGEPTIISGEFVYTCRKGKRGLLGYMYNHRSQGEAFQWNEGIHDQSYRFYPDGKQGHETMPFMTGRIVDVNNALDGDGPFAPDRAGSIPSSELIKVCFSGQYTKEELLKFISSKGGLVAYLGTNSVIQVMERIAQGDQRAKKVLDAMCYNIVKQIGAMAAALSGSVQAIVLTGGIAYNEPVVEYIRERCSFIAPIAVYPGENELEALVTNALVVLRGVITPKVYK